MNVVEDEEAEEKRRNSMEFDDIGLLFKAISYLLIMLLYTHAGALVILWAWLALDALRAQIETDPAGIVSLSPVPLSRTRALQLWAIASANWQATVACVIGFAVFCLILMKTLPGLKIVVLDIIFPLLDVYTDLKTVVFKYMFRMRQFVWGGFALSLLFLEPLWNCISSGCSNGLPSIIAVQRIACSELGRTRCCSAIDADRELQITEHKFMESVLESIPQFNIQAYTTWWMVEQKTVCNNNTISPSYAEYWQCDVAHEEAWQVENFQYTSLAMSFTMMVFGIGTWTLKCYPDDSHIKKPLVYFMCFAKCYGVFSRVVLYYLEEDPAYLSPKLVHSLFEYGILGTFLESAIYGAILLPAWVHLFDPQHRGLPEVLLRGFLASFAPVMTPLPGHGTLEATAMKLQSSVWLLFAKPGFVWRKFLLLAHLPEWLLRTRPLLLKLLFGCLIVYPPCLSGCAIAVNLWTAAKLLRQPSLSITGLVLNLSYSFNALVALGIPALAVQGVGRWAEPKAEILNPSYRAIGTAASSHDEQEAE